VAYSDFTLKKVKRGFNIKTIEKNSLFPNTEELEERNVVLTPAINTEIFRHRFQCTQGKRFNRILRLRN